MAEELTHEQIFSKLAGAAVIPVVALDDAEQAIPLADALTAGGIAVIEITFRTPAAAEAIERLAKQRPDMLVGAGTVLSTDNLHEAQSRGAQFAIAPGLNVEVVEEAADIGMPMIPGISTASELEGAMGLGCRMLKFFPAEALGGVALIKALSGPYRHTGVQLVPTGGVTEENLADYLGLGIVAAVGGTWLAKPADIEAGNWKAITGRCRKARAIAETS